MGNVVYEEYCGEFITRSGELETQTHFDSSFRSRRLLISTHWILKSISMGRNTHGKVK